MYYSVNLISIVYLLKFWDILYFQSDSKPASKKQQEVISCQALTLLLVICKFNFKKIRYYILSVGN